MTLAYVSPVLLRQVAMPEKLAAAHVKCLRFTIWVIHAQHQGMSVNFVHAGNSFIRRWQRQYYLKKLEEQAKEASVHAQLDDLEQVSAALTLCRQILSWKEEETSASHSIRGIPAVLIGMLGMQMPSKSCCQSCLLE